MKPKEFAKTWSLPLSIMAGASGYWLCASLPLPDAVFSCSLRMVAVVQPVLIFMMLFITFCRVEVGDLRLRRWHWLGLAFQSAAFVLTACLSACLPHGWAVVTEGAMLCLVCPTATAAAVVTSKLGGSAERVTAYTVMINLAASVLFSAVQPLLHPQDGMDFVVAFSLIVARVFPLLLIPIAAAACARRWLPGVVAWLRARPDLAFRLWTVALALAIGMTVRSIVHSDYPFVAQAGIAVSSACACAVQFAVGRWLGSFEGDMVTAGQALGQKNTVVAIWMGYTFLDPITSIAGGFYSVWHNLFNSWQLYQARKQSA